VSIDTIPGPDATYAIPEDENSMKLPLGTDTFPISLPVELNLTKYPLFFVTYTFPFGPTPTFWKDAGISLLQIVSFVLGFTF
jgi:hypothetical protein